MKSALKLLTLPTLFILPWLWLKLGNREALIRNIFVNDPLWVGILLLPGVIVFVVWTLNQLRKS